MAKKTTEEFIEAAVNKFGARYDYSEVAYKGTDTKILITCKDHGQFKQTPYKHLASKHGCPVCARMATVAACRGNTEMFTTDAKAMHGNKYDYSKVNYKAYNRKVKIVCPVHGVVLQTPEKHLKKGGKGCEACGLEAAIKTRTKTQEEITAELKGRFVVLGKYINDNTAINMECCECRNIVKIQPGNLLSGQGCPACAEYGFNPSKPTILYYIAIKGGYYKIGITNNSVCTRYNNRELKDMRVVKEWMYTIGAEAREAEAKILDDHIADKYYGEALLVTGNTEIFTRDVLGLDSECKEE